MFKYLLAAFVLMASIANANTPFQRLPWRLQPAAASYIAIMTQAQVTSNEYLGDGNLGRSNIYKENAAHSNIKVPAIHAYNPKTCRMAAIELDPALRSLLPASLPIPDAQVTRLFISIELLDSEPLRFRPHRFVDRNCPDYATNPQYSYAPQIQAGVFNLDGTQVQFTDIAGAGLVQAGISIHAGAPVPAQGLAGTQILSPDNMHIPAVQNDPSRAYYSIIAHNDGQSRAAVTLHWLINENDANEMWRLLRGSRTIDEFSCFIDQTGFRNSAAAREVQKLLPQQAAVARAAADDDNDDDDAVVEAMLLSAAMHETGGAATSSTTNTNDADLAEAIAVSSAMHDTAGNANQDEARREELELQLMLALSAAGEFVNAEEKPTE